MKRTKEMLNGKWTGSTRTDSRVRFGSSGGYGGEGAAKNDPNLEPEIIDFAICLRRSDFGNC